MGKRRHMIGFRVNAEEYHEIMKGLDASKKHWKMSEYIRALATGELRHPFHDDDGLTTPKGGDVSDSGFIVGGYETRIHYTAYVLAAEMMRVKMDPAYHEIIGQNKEMYNTLVDQIRGYAFDEKTQMKSPLSRHVVGFRSDP